MGKVLRCSFSLFGTRTRRKKALKTTTTNQLTFKTFLPISKQVLQQLKHCAPCALPSSHPGCSHTQQHTQAAAALAVAALACLSPQTLGRSYCSPPTPLSDVPRGPLLLLLYPLPLSLPLSQGILEAHITLTGFLLKYKP